MGRFRNTEQTLKIFDYILDYKQENDCNSPTVREIQDHFGYRTTSTVHWQLINLQRMGKIEYPEYGKSRHIVVVGGYQNALLERNQA